ncbi:MAG: uracil-DNA glycosylase, partial [Rhodocyclaceae bacterium]|nr:uracil-DNA glycosylase [Rhodocyclaceae bacterium]
MRMNAVRAALLREMGLTPLWRPREAPPLVLREAAAPRPAKTQTAPAAPQPSARARSSEPAKSALPARVLSPVTAPATPQRAAPPPAA